MTQSLKELIDQTQFWYGIFAIGKAYTRRSWTDRQKDKDAKLYEVPVGEHLLTQLKKRARAYGERDITPLVEFAFGKLVVCPVEGDPTKENCVLAISTCAPADNFDRKVGKKVIKSRLRQFIREPYTANFIIEAILPVPVKPNKE